MKRIEDQFDLIHNNFMKTSSCQASGTFPQRTHDVRLSKDESFHERNSSSVEYFGRGVETIRYRLRKKFALEREDSLTDYLSNKL